MEIKKGKLKIFFGYSAGVGKTYAMLQEAHELRKTGVDIVVGYIEPHARQETTALLTGLEILTPKEVDYKGIKLKEFDIDQAIKRKPQIILVDELAHTNVSGSRNQKRYLDVQELLNAGIDVYTTLNVQHLEGINDLVNEATQVTTSETIPDAIFNLASELELIDIEPQDLILRLRQGKVYKKNQADLALENFFTVDNLNTLREIAMRRSADRIIHKKVVEQKNNAKVLVLITSSISSPKNIRVASRLATANHTTFTALYVETSNEAYVNNEVLKTNFELVQKLGGETIVLYGDDVPAVVSEYVNLHGVTNIILGKSWKKYYRKNSFENRLISLLPTTEILIVPFGFQKSTLKKQNWFFLKFDLLSVIKVVLINAILVAIFYAARDFPIVSVAIFAIALSIVSFTSKTSIYGIFTSLVAAFAFFFLVTDSAVNDTLALKIVDFFIFLIIGIVYELVILHLKKKVDHSHHANRVIDATNNLTANLSNAQNNEEVLKKTVISLSKIFNRSVWIYNNDFHPIKIFSGKNNETPASFFEVNETAIATWVIKNNAVAGVGTNTLTNALGYYFPISVNEKLTYAVGISCNRDKSPLSFQEILLLKSLTNIIKLALGSHLN
ncbi:sensor histidine kinase [[Mycoplasma] testudinis]|uniref:sensor histidine kinase n=1 Tax=[Mycoplasma] testudinis TaxID=33924 RepID=UPI000697D295|nr:sensor histidine kinase KdpD [[Mycoplasma] testudinis]